MTTQSSVQRFGRWLDLTMRNRDLSGKEVAKKLKVTEGAVSKWRKGVSVPQANTTLKLARVLGVTPPLRLLVTAGLLDSEIAGVEPLPLPEPTAQRAYVRDKINEIPYMTSQERQHLIDAYDDYTDKLRREQPNC